MKKSRQYWDEGNMSEPVGSRGHAVRVYVCVCVPSSLSASKRGMDCSKTFFFFTSLVSCLFLKKMLMKNYYCITNVLNIQII